MNTFMTSREAVASFATYDDAQRAVDALSDRGFPVERLSIVAEDLRFVETITGRRGYAQAAAQGAGTGATIGALIGFFFGALDWVDPLISGLALATYGLLLGAALGALAGVAAHWSSAGRRDFSSALSIDAGRYVLLCDDEAAPGARAELAASNDDPGR